MGAAPLTLPLSRHRFHGDWNYTLSPAHPDPADASPHGRQAHVPAGGEPDSPAPESLRDPELTGMTADQLDALTSRLTDALDDRRERMRHERRGSVRHRARGAGAKDKLVPTDRVLATVLYLRRLATQELLGQLFGVNRSTITNAVAEVRPVLDEIGHHVPASTARFRTPADVTRFLAPDPRPRVIKPAC